MAKRTARKYEVWRFHVLQMTGTFKEVRTWLIENDPCNAERYAACRRAHTKHYSEKNDSLSWAVIGTEYCCVKPVKEVTRAGM